MSPTGNEELSELVQGHPFFHGFTAANVRAMSENAVARTYEAGDVLATEGTPANEFLLLFEGKVALEVGASDHPHITVQTVGPGEVLGWSWLVPPHRWRFDVRALKRTRVIAMDGGVLRRVLAARPSLGYKFLIRFLPLLAERLENTRVQLLDIHGL